MELEQLFEVFVEYWYASVDVRLLTLLLKKTE